MLTEDNDGTTDDMHNLEGTGGEGASLKLN